MVDDWSLEGKGIAFAGGEVLEVNKVTRLYDQETIETLRQKLIDDVLELSLKYVKYSDVIPASIPPGEVKKIINKRFGMDE